MRETDLARATLVASSALAWSRTNGGKICKARRFSMAIAAKPIYATVVARRSQPSFSESASAEIAGPLQEHILLSPPLPGGRVDVVSSFFLKSSTMFPHWSLVGLDHLDR